ncbi:diadenosine tetraphosphate hydrolase [Cellulophaga baltica 18]|uniref:Diadenosine tetraphosphate hydrolase n=1 Tax=Cellulophaga baltica 18 TaxID=1348584 RepID=A0AAU8RUE4_9FLAO|nr:diadenosine tetraphosphate hydrolase [Cellulophaga baltica 18]
MVNFRNIEYLKSGNERQKLAFSEIKKYKVLEKLKKYNPILAGTIPIEIDVPESDLDIICECQNHSEFKAYLLDQFSQKKDFKVYSILQNDIESTIAEFKTENFLFEIFGQNIPTERQDAYRHMIIERNILEEKGFEFKQKVKDLKSSGIKTEPAFAKLLGLEGDPYIELLKLEK